MSMKKAGITIFSLLIMLIVILLTVRGCSISKKTEENTPQNNQPEVVVSQETSNSEKEPVLEDTTEDSSKNTVNNSLKDNEKSDVEKVDDIDENKNIGFIEVSEPELGGISNIDALVSSKKSYLVNNETYAYSISLVIPLEEGVSIVDYYCPKKTYDAVMSGESVKVDYQLDKDGKISISSISK